MLQFPTERRQNWQYGQDVEICSDTSQAPHNYSIDVLGGCTLRAQAIRPNADPSKNAGWVKNEWVASRLAIDEGLGSWDKPWASRCPRGSKDLGCICSPLLEIWWSTGFWGCSIFGHDLEIVASNPGFPAACVLAGLMQICHYHRQCALWETARVFGNFTAVISPLVCWSAVGGFFAPSVVLAAVLVRFINTNT